MKHNYVRHSLERQIFLSLVGISFSSVILIALFWASSKYGDYKHEIYLLKTNFSDDQKEIIRNNVLKVKDYIHWARNNPLIPISITLAAEMNHLTVQGGIPQGNHLPFTTQPFAGSGSAIRVPICILNEQGEIMYSFNPFKRDTTESFDSPKTRLLDQVRAAEAEKGLITIYEPANESDSELTAICCYDKIRIPGFTMAALVSSEEFNNVIRHHLLDSISKMRFSENEYVFVNTMNGEALVTHGKYNNPPVKILSSGNQVWVDIYKVQQKAFLNAEGGFHTYPWPKLSSSDMAVKTSFFSHVPDLHWIIGTGYYEDEINSVIEAKKRTLIGDLRIYMYKVLFYLLFSIFISFLLAKFLSRRLDHHITLFRNFFDKSATGNHYIDKSQFYYREFDFMADSANRMVDARIVAEAEIKKLHDELEERVFLRTRQLHEANKDLESFSYSVSHDLRAPLRAIDGFSSILATRHSDALDDEGKQYLHYVIDASRRMEQLIDDLLKYSRIGRKTVELGLVSLNEIFDNILIVFKSEIEAISAELIKEGILPDIISDKILLHQIFTNLVSNAIKYRRKDVPLVIRAGYKHEDHQHIIYINDNGIGIAEEHRQIIFHVFQRLHDEATHPGTGIGLASAEKAVNLLKGVIWVESAMNQGSTFYIKLPE